MTCAETIHAVKVWCAKNDERKFLFVYYLGIEPDGDGDIWQTNEGAFDLFYDKKNMISALKKAKSNPDEIEFPER